VSDKEKSLTMVTHLERTIKAPLRAQLDTRGYLPDSCLSPGRSVASVEWQNPDRIPLSRGISSGAGGHWIGPWKALESRSQDVHSSRELDSRAIVFVDPDERPSPSRPPTRVRATFGGATPGEKRSLRTSIVFSARFKIEKLGKSRETNACNLEGPGSSRLI